MSRGLCSADFPTVLKRKPAAVPWLLLASVIDTCRLRCASSFTYMASVIRAARTGATLPPLSARRGVLNNYDLAMFRGGAS